MVGKQLAAILESGVNDAVLLQPVTILMAVVLDAACSRLVQAGMQDNLFIAFDGHGQQVRLVWGGALEAAVYLAEAVGRK